MCKLLNTLETPFNVSWELKTPTTYKNSGLKRGKKFFFKETLTEIKGFMKDNASW